MYKQYGAADFKKDIGLPEDYKEAGDIIIPTASYGNESSTRMYQPKNDEFLYFSDEDTNKQLKDLLQTLFTVHDGKVITCQGALAESIEDVERWSKEGYGGVEMESSTFFAVSNFFYIPTAAMLVIADNLIKNESVLDDSYQIVRPKIHAAREHLFIAAFKIKFS